MKVAILKNPPRKHHAWPWVLLGLYLLFLASPIIGAYVFIHDPDTKKVDLDPNFSLSSMGHRIITDSLDNTVTQEKMAMSITENDMDNILDASLNKAGFKNEVFKKAYIKINNDSYCFYLDIDAVLIKTRVRLITTMTESADKKAFLFMIKDVAIGRIGGMTQLSRPLVDRYLNESIVSSFFEKAGITMSFDKENYALVYKKSDVIGDLNKMNSSGGMSIYYDIIRTLVDRDETEFSHKDGIFLNVDFDLKRLKENDLSKGAAEHLKVNPADVTKQCKEKIVALVNNKAIDPTTTDTQLIFAFLFSGYNALSDTGKETIKNIDFSSIGINDVTTYVGFNLLTSNDYLTKHMSDHMMTFSELEAGATEITLLSENDLNTFIAGRNIFGFTSILDRYESDGKYKLNYITVDNFYGNIYQDATKAQIAEFVCKVNVNGYHTSLTFTTNAKVGDKQDEITFVVLKENGIQYGSVSAPELDESFFTLIANTLNVGDTAISANKDERSITMHFGDIVEKAKTSLKEKAEETYAPYGTAAVELAKAKIDETFATENVEINIVGDNRYAEGGINLRLKENKYLPPV